jgi:hypothetical protein
MQSCGGNDGLDHLTDGGKLGTLKNRGIRVENRSAEEGKRKNEACHNRRCCFV